MSDDVAQEFRDRLPHAACVDISGAGHMVAGGDNDALTNAITEFLTMNGMPARIERGHRRQQQFVADASHELRSPLTRMRGHLEVDQGTDADNAQLIDTRAKILDDLSRLEALVDDLLVIARHDENTPLARTEPVDLDDIVLADISARRPASGVAFDKTHVSGAQVSGDPTQLARAIRNVLDNGTAYSPPVVVPHPCLTQRSTGVTIGEVRQRVVGANHQLIARFPDHSPTGGSRNFVSQAEYGSSILLIALKTPGR